MTLGILVVMIGLGTTDALLIEKGKHLPALPPPQQYVDGELVDNEPGNPATRQPGNPTDGVRKYAGPDVLAVLTQQQLEYKAGEKMLLQKIIPEDEATVHAQIIFKNGDRAGAIGWVDSPNVKRYFLSLKEALHATFTPAVQDLIDETQRREGKPPRNLLTFLDTGILDERIAFVRVRERLYELHITESEEDAIFELIEKLTE